MPLIAVRFPTPALSEPNRPDTHQTTFTYRHSDGRQIYGWKPYEEFLGLVSQGTTFEFRYGDNITRRHNNNPPISLGSRAWLQLTFEQIHNQNPSDAAHFIGNQFPLKPLPPHWVESLDAATYGNPLVVPDLLRFDDSLTDNCYLEWTEGTQRYFGEVSGIAAQDGYLATFVRFSFPDTFWWPYPQRDRPANHDLTQRRLLKSVRPPSYEIFDSGLADFGYYLRHGAHIDFRLGTDGKLHVTRDGINWYDIDAVWFGVDRDLDDTFGGIVAVGDPVVPVGGLTEALRFPFPSAPSSDYTEALRFWFNPADNPFQPREPVPAQVPTTGLHVVIDWVNRGRHPRRHDLRPDNALTQFDRGGGIKDDVTPYVLSLQCKLGRSNSDTLLGIDDGGSLTVLLQDQDERFTPFDWKGDAGTEPKPGREVMVWAETGDAATPYIPVWGGRLNEITPSEMQDGAKVVELTADGPIAYLGRRATRNFIPGYTFDNETVFAGEVAEEVLDLIQYGQRVWPRDKRLLARGVQPLDAGRVVENVVGAPDSLRGETDMLRDLARAEGGYVYGDREGRIVFEGRHDRYDRFASLGVLPEIPASDVVDLTFGSYLDGIYNIFSAEGAAAARSLAPVEAFDYQSDVTASPYFTRNLVAGQVVDITVNTDTWIANQPLAEQQQLVRYNSFAVAAVEVNEDGTFGRATADGNVTKFLQDSYPNLVLRVGIAPGVTGTYRIFVVYATATLETHGTSTISVRAVNQQSLEDVGLREYFYPARLMRADLAGETRQQAYLDWAAKHYGNPLEKIRITGRNTPEHLRHSVGDFVSYGGGRRYIIEAVEILATSGKLDWTFEMVSATPWQERIS